MSQLLNLVIFVPALGALFVLLISRDRPNAVRTAALIVSLITFALSLPLALLFDSGSGGMQFSTDAIWIESPSIHYHVAVDGISIFLVLLVTFLTVLCVLISWRSIHAHVKEFFFFLLLLETGTIGVFVSMDLFLFYVFWEITLVPMYFLIGIWGHERRIYAAVKFFLYTVVGSLLMLVGILWLYNRFSTFDYQTILAMLAAGSVRFSPEEELWLFLAFFAAFAIKVPLFPFHTWLPDAHVEAPTAGSVMLAGVLLKMGTYGLLRFCLPLFPDAAHALAPAIVALAIVGIIYGSLVAMVQPDLKKLIAYSSVAHLGFVVLGIFSFNAIAIQGAVYQMLNHGVSTGALFLLVGMIYDRLHTRNIADMGGLATPAPVLASLFLITTLSSIGLPLLNNFVGEFLILLGVLQERTLYAALAATGVVFSAAYMLWMYQRVFYGEPRPEHAHFADLTGREKTILVSSIAVMIFMGLGSPYFLNRMNASTAELLDQAGRREIRVEQTTPPAVPATMPQALRSSPGSAPSDDCQNAGPAPFPVSDLAKNAAEKRGPAAANYLERANKIMPAYDLTALSPEFILTLTGVILMMVGAFGKIDAARWCTTIALLGLFAATCALIFLRPVTGFAFGGMFSVDPFGRYFSLLFYLITALVALASGDYVRRERLAAGEYYALLVFATVGMGLMASANELILIFIGLEISSLSSYILVGFRRDAANSSEAALKYFLLGSFATAFLLYGIALLFGVTGSTRLTEIRAVLHGGEHPVSAGLPAATGLASSGILHVQLAWQEAGFPSEVLGLAIALIFVGLAFKISAAPFQSWTPDVYQGAPAPVAAFLSTGPKAAAFAAFLRIFEYSLAASAAQWTMLLWASSALTMFIGNLAGLWQSNLKRLLAYSSIAHAGYMLVAFTAHSEDGVAAILFYLAAYAFMNIGAFVVVSHLSRRGERYVELDDFAGLGFRSPALAACFSIFLMSLIGIPLTGGFLGKFYIFRAALHSDLIWLTILGVLNSAIAAYYYLRILVSMYMQESQNDVPVEHPGLATQAVLALCTIATFVLGIFPQVISHLVLSAAQWFPSG